jgi:hypothetical protein
LSLAHDLRARSIAIILASNSEAVSLTLGGSFIFRV